MTRIIPIRTKEQFNELCSLCLADDHGVVAPTHLMLKDNKIVGYFSLGAVPVVFSWFSTKELAVRDSTALILQAETAFASMYGRDVPARAAVPCPIKSPFHPLMPSLGYLNLGNYDLFTKEL